MSDLIDRAAAIDAVYKCTDIFINNLPVMVDKADAYKALAKLPSAQPYTDEEIQKMQDLEQAELDKAYECGRASAQPEIVRCKDCEHYEGGWYCSAWNNSPGFPIVTEKGYCNLAERRTDG